MSWGLAANKDRKLHGLIPTECKRSASGLPLLFLGAFGKWILSLLDRSLDSKRPRFAKTYGLGCGVGRGLGVGANLGVGDGLAVAVGVGETVPVAVAVGVALIVAVAVGVALTVAVAVGVALTVVVADGDAVGVAPPHIACGDTVIV